MWNRPKSPNITSAKVPISVISPAYTVRFVMLPLIGKSGTYPIQYVFYLSVGLADWSLGPMGCIGIQELDRNLQVAVARVYYFKYQF